MARRPMFCGDGGYDQNCIYDSVAERHPEAAVVVSPRATAVPGDGHLRHVAEHGRMAWQNAPGYNRCARVEASMNRWKQVIGAGLRAHTE